MRISLSRASLIVVTLVSVGVSSGSGLVTLPAVISDNMVLQSGAKVAIWGLADPGEEVSVTVAGARASTTAVGDGTWKVAIGPLQPGGPFEMTVEGKNTIVVHNVVAGEVWICSGQSNMEFHVGTGPDGWKTGVINYEQEVASAHYPQIRMFTAQKTVAGSPQKDVVGKWEITSPATVGHFSAVGYFFGLNLFESLHEPVGLIHTSWGGTPAESWTTAATLGSDPDFDFVAANWRKLNEKYPAQLDDFRNKFDEWRKAAQKAESAGTVVPAAPKIPDDPRISPWRPSGLFNAMIVPLTPYGIKGAIWYQGESNGEHGIEYRKLFPAMIRDWRGAWGEGDFPFLFVQLASFAPMPSTASFPLVREAQLMTLSLPKTGMAVTTDLGDATDIHPRNKQEVGRRLALAARAIAYGQDITYSGPIYESMNQEGDKIRLHFKQVGAGLTFGAANAFLQGFEIAGADRKFHGAVATIEGDTVVVHSEQVEHPAAVRYAWRNFPVCNLYNQSGLPASPFRTDDWPDLPAAK